MNDGFRRKQSWSNKGTIPKFAWNDYGKPRKVSFGIGGALTEITTQHLPYTTPILWDLGIELAEEI